MQLQPQLGWGLHCGYAKRIIKGVTDSKKLTHEKRLELFSKLQRWGHYQVQIASVNEINDIGIYLARNRAIIQAIRGLMSRLQPTQKVRVIIDGKFSKAWLARMGSPGIEVECMIKGDEKIYECGAASIIGRVYADALFEGFGKFFPGYNIERNHGSPDKVMYEKIRKDGACPYMRVNYAKSWWEKIRKGKTK